MTKLREASFGGLIDGLKGGVSPSLAPRVGKPGPCTARDLRYKHCTNLHFKIPFFTLYQACESDAEY